MGGLGIPLRTRATTWDGYEEAFGSALAELAGAGVSVGVFGDIDSGYSGPRSRGIRGGIRLRAPRNRPEVAP